MKLALRELWRRPGRFAAAGLILTLLAMLLMFLGGLLDGLIQSSTSAIESLDADAVVYRADAPDSFLRSRIDPALRSEVEAVPGVSEVGGIGVVQLGARAPGKGPRDLLDVVLLGTEIAPKGLDALPAPGQVVADSSLREEGVTEGMELLVGPARSPVTVSGFIDDTQYSGQAVLWADTDTWRMVLVANRPDQQLPDGVYQSLLVRGDGSVGAATLVTDIDAATGDATLTRTVADAAAKLPGVEQQSATFNQIIGVTVGIAVVVVALFFALLTVERAGLYGVLKAIGARSATLFGGLIIQALVLTLIAGILAGGAALGLDAAIPPGSIPLQMSAGRIGQTMGYLVVAAIVGCAFSLRRLLRVDPASAIGSSS